MNPMMVEVTRGGIVESEHRVHVAIASHDGIEIQGDGERLTFPARQPIDAGLTAGESGGTPCWPDARAIGLACASHGGESGTRQCSGGMADSARPNRGTFRMRS